MQGYCTCQTVVQWSCGPVVRLAVKFTIGLESLFVKEI